MIGSKWEVKEVCRSISNTFFLMWFWCSLPGHLLHKVCVRLILNVHTSRSCRKYVFVAKLWISPVRMARRNSKVSLFQWWVLPRGFQLRKTIVMGGTFMYFQGSLLRSMTLRVSQDIALSCLTVPHIRHTRRFGNPY